MSTYRDTCLRCGRPGHWGLAGLCWRCKEDDRLEREREEEDRDED